MLRILRYLSVCYRVLLCLYPAELRSAYGSEMANVFEQVLRTEWQRRGARGVAATGCRAIGELFTVATRLPLREVATGTSPGGGTKGLRMRMCASPENSGNSLRERKRTHSRLLIFGQAVPPAFEFVSELNLDNHISIVRPM